MRKLFYGFVVCASLLSSSVLVAANGAGNASTAAKADGVRVLYDFSKPIGEGLLQRRGAETRITERGTLYVKLLPGMEWPGITLLAPGGHWDLSESGYFHIRVSNVGSNVSPVGIRVDNPGANGSVNCLQVMTSIVAGQSYEFNMVIPRGGGKMTVEMFGMRGYPPEAGGGMGGGRSIDPSNVIGLLVFAHNLKEPLEVEVERVWVSGSANAHYKKVDPKDFFPCFDTYGQFIHREWPGKVKDAADLTSRIGIEEADLAKHPGPSDWNKWGGWATGPSLKATGFFRVEKYQGKWWLVDPDGKLFFSHGPDCVTWGNSTPITDREHWFKNFVGNDPKYKWLWYTQWHVVRGYYKGKKPRVFDISAANVMRKYGDDWKKKFGDISHRRLRSWGMNTIANWSNQEIYLQRRTPYFVSLGTSSRQISGSKGYWGKMRDMFAPEFAEKFRARVQKEIGKSANDPWCIGYFVDNELSWGDEHSFGLWALTSPADQPAKLEFVKDLRSKYSDIGSLNTAWGTGYASWDDVVKGQDAPDLKRANEDFVTFTRKCARQYFSVIKGILKELAPNQLYAGCRFAWSNKIAANEAAEYCDIVSYNLYRRHVKNFKCRSGKDVPLIIGEFHFGALDRGMFHTGLVGVSNQEERGKAYEKYVQSVLEHPQFVGCHWFKYMDEPATGRGLDGENYQIGFLDIVDTPYPETIEKSREIGYKMYEYRLNGK